MTAYLFLALRSGNGSICSQPFYGTTVSLHQALLAEPDIQNGDYSIKWLEEWLAKSA